MSKDPQGSMKSIVIFNVTEAVCDALSAFPGVRAIVKHTTGKGDDTRPHLHVWWEGEPVTNTGLKKRVKQVPALAGLSGSTDWSWRNADSYAIWCKYTTRNLSHVIIKSDDDLNVAHEAAISIPIVARPADSHQPVIINPKKLTSEEKMIKYIQNDPDFRWTPEQFSVSQLEELYPRPTTLQQYAQQCRRAVVAYTRGRVYNNQLIALTRNVMYVFGDDDVRRWLKETIGKSLDYV